MQRHMHPAYKHSYMHTYRDAYIHAQGDRRTALHWAALNGHRKCCEILQVCLCLLHVRKDSSVCVALCVSHAFTSLCVVFLHGYTYT